MGNQTGRHVNSAQNILPRASVENHPQNQEHDSPQVSIWTPLSGSPLRVSALVVFDMCMCSKSRWVILIMMITLISFRVLNIGHAA